MTRSWAWVWATERKLENQDEFVILSKAKDLHLPEPKVDVQ
jgi:hypothetical protein